MPRSDKLPSSISQLVRRQALELSPNRFAADTEHLLAVIKRSLAHLALSDPSHQVGAHEATKPRFCPNCADPVEVDETICDKCGMKLV